MSTNITSTIDATLEQFGTTLNQIAPDIADRLQPGLTIPQIETHVNSFHWTLPQDGWSLYQWHNGLSGKPGELNLVEKFLRLKGKWHGELAGRENEIHLGLDEEILIAKFLPLEYALAGHRHLKLGRCSLDLLPIAILQRGQQTIYCMMQLIPEKPTIYCANGTNLPPAKVTEAFLSTQIQFTQLADLLTHLMPCLQPPGFLNLHQHQSSNQETQMTDVDFVLGDFINSIHEISRSINLNQSEQTKV